MRSHLPSRENSLDDLGRGDAQAANVLKLAGIRGIRYPAGGAAGRGGALNYSIFEPEALNVLRRLDVDEPLTDEIRLASGQMARLKGGVLEVVGGKRPQYRLTVEHRDGGQFGRPEPESGGVAGVFGRSGAAALRAAEPGVGGSAVSADRDLVRGRLEPAHLRPSRARSTRRRSNAGGPVQRRHETGPNGALEWPYTIRCGDGRAIAGHVHSEECAEADRVRAQSGAAMSVPGMLATAILAAILLAAALHDWVQG